MTDAPSRKKASSAATDSGETNPLALVAGGVALGIAIGALLPRLEKEKELLAPIGKRIVDSASAAVGAARDAGKAEIDAILPNGDAAREQISKVIGSAIAAAKSAGSDTGKS